MEELGVKALSILVDNLQKGVEIMPAYVQDLLERYIESEMIWNYVWIGFCVFGVIFAICLIIYWKKEDDGWFIFTWWVMAFLLLIIMCTFIYSLFRLMYVPELYMIDELMWYWCNCSK